MPLAASESRLASRHASACGLSARWAGALAICCATLCAQPVTYNKNLAPIVYSRCAPCHRPGEAAPFPLLSYSDVRKHSGQIVDLTSKRYMPPWMPEQGYGDFSGSWRLTDAQIALFAQWVKQGMIEGNSADLPQAPQFTTGWFLGQPDMIVRMNRAYTLPAGGGDVWRNFVMQVDLKETKYIRAFELRPNNKKVVHHANVILDRSRLLRRRDGKDGEVGFSGMDVETEASGEFDPDSHFLFWKPGSPTQVEPVDGSWKLDPGSDLIVNLHLQPSGKPEAVTAEIGLYFADRAPSQHPMLIQMEHDGALNVPPGDKNFLVTDHLKLPIPVRVLSVYPHQHYLGKTVEAWADTPDGKRVPLIRISRWDINWQASYTYRDPVFLPAGTVLQMRLTFDNSEDNPRNPNHPPKMVRAGNRTEDEMGHVWFQLLPQVPDSEDDPRLVLQQAVMRRRIEKYPADFVAHFNLGAALQATGHYDEALHYLTKATEIRPADAMARNNLAVVLFALERYDDAAAQFRIALEHDPGYPSARYNLARTLFALRDGAGALEELGTLFKTSPDDAQARDFAGRVLAAMGKFADALPQFRRAAQLAPGDSGIQTNLGAALASTGDLAGAAEAFEKALRADPQNEAARANLARVRKALEGKN